MSHRPANAANSRPLSTTRGRHAEIAQSEDQGSPTWLELGLAATEADLLHAAGLPRPNPLQAAAAQRTDILTGGHALILAATAAGKTGVGLMAIVRALGVGRIGAIVVPTRALADEVYRRLARAWGDARPQGAPLRIALSTGEHTRDDQAIRASRADVIVAVYEKFRALVGASPVLAARLGCVVADEIHILADAQRGAGADLMLTALLARDGAVQLVGLGGALEDGESLSRWIGTEPLIWRGRPQPLRLGTLCLVDGWFCYRNTDSLEAGHGLERLLEPRPSAPATNCDPGPGAPSSGREAHEALRAVCRLARRLRDQGENLLVFVPTRRLAREWACYLSTSLAESRPAVNGDPSLTSLPRAYAAIEAAEEGHGRRLLLDCARAGVGFHSGDLAPVLRAAVEQAFAAGQLPVLISTPTLAEGVNLGCHNVLIVPGDVLAADGGAGATDGVCGPIALDRRRLAHMAGRAGRNAQPAGDSATTTARAMVLVRDRDAASRTWQDLLEPITTGLLAADRDDTLETMILGTVAGLNRASRATLAHRLMHTFLGVTRWQADPSAFHGRLHAAVNRLLDWELITEETDDDPEQPTTDHTPLLAPTPAGRLAATHGLTPQAATYLAAALPHWPDLDDGPARDLALLLTAAHCLHPGDAPVPVPAPGTVRAQSLHEALATELGPITIPGLNAYSDPARQLPAEELGAGLRALMARDWIAGEPLPTLEARYRVFAGALGSLGTLLAHTLQAMASLAATLPATTFPVQHALALAQRLPQGLPAEAAGLAGLTASGLSRTDALLLAREGFDSVEALATAQPGVLEGILGDESGSDLREQARLLLAVTQWQPAPDPLRAHAPIRDTRRTAAAHRPATQSNNPDMAMPVPGPALILDPAQPGQATILGNAIPLSPLAWHLLMLLAARPGRVTAYTIIRQTLWQGLRVGDQLVRFHKRRLDQALKAAGAADWIRTRHGIGLILNLEPGQVQILSREGAVAA
jgi:replicative superfamily II helicase